MCVVGVGGGQGEVSGCEFALKQQWLADPWLGDRLQER